MRRRPSAQAGIEGADPRAAQAREGGARRALLRRPRIAGTRRRNRRLRRAIRSKWRASAAITRRRRWSSPGVRFMGETAKILSPEKRVLMPDLDATCSLDLGCPADEFSRFLRRASGPHCRGLREHQRGREGAGADWMVTSSIGLEIVADLHARAKRSCGRRIAISAATSRTRPAPTCCCWQGSCLVHDEFKGIELDLLRAEHPDAKILVHPESPASGGGAGGCRRLDDPAHRRRACASTRSASSSRRISGFCTRCGSPRPARPSSKRPTAGNSCDLQELRALPVDGDERPRESRGGAGARPQRNLRRSGDGRACASADRPHARPSRRATRSACRRAAIRRRTARSFPTWGGVMASNDFVLSRFGRKFARNAQLAKHSMQRSLAMSRMRWRKMSAPATRPGASFPPTPAARRASRCARRRCSAACRGLRR